MRLGKPAGIDAAFYKSLCSWMDSVESELRALRQKVLDLDSESAKLRLALSRSQTVHGENVLVGDIPLVNSSGLIDTRVLGSGVADGTVSLHGDGTWS